MICQWPSLIAHVDMDAFFASIEQRDNPELRGKPTVVTASSYSRIIVAASYEAKALGYRAGQKTPQYHNLHIQHANIPHYLSISQSIKECLYDITPDIEIFSIDEGFLDLKGVMHHFNSELEIIQHIQQSIYNKTQLTCSIGLAPNKSLAKMASEENKPNGYFIVYPDRISEYLKGKPIETICGIGPKMKKFLNKHDVYTCDQMTKMPISFISSHFGQIGRNLWYACQGISSSQLSRPKQPKTMGHSKRLAQHPYQHSDIQQKLHELALKLCQRLRKHKLKALALHISIHTQTKYYKKQYNLHTATHYQGELTPYYLQILEEINWPETITQIGIRATQLTGETQLDLLETGKIQPEDLLDLIGKHHTQIASQFIT